MIKISETQRIMPKESKSHFWMIVLNYYDGAVDGIIELEEIRYRFVMIDDNGKNIRIYALSKMNSELFDQIVQTFSLSEKPIYPTWIPRFQYKDENTEIENNQRIVDLLTSKEKVEATIAMDTLQNTLITIKTLANDEIFSAKSDIGIISNNQIDWFDYLGVSKD